jgi:hypothetical protein
MSPEGTVDPGDAERMFVQPPLVRTLALQGAVVSAIAAVSIVVTRARGLWENDALQLLSVGFCIVSLYVSIAMLKGSRDSFVAAGEGLWQHSPGKPSVLLRWEDIGDVYPENVMQRLIVADRSGTRRVAIEFHVQEFGELRRMILERASKRSD